MWSSGSQENSAVCSIKTLAKSPLGLIKNLNGTGWLKKMPSTEKSDKKQKTYEIIPGEKAGVTLIGLPNSSIAVPISNTLSIQAIAIHNCESAAYRPGQILRPYPKATETGSVEVRY